MESVVDLIGGELVSPAGVEFFVAVAVATLVLVSGLAARVIELWEERRPSAGRPSAEF